MPLGSKISGGFLFYIFVNGRLWLMNFIKIAIFIFLKKNKNIADTRL